MSEQERISLELHLQAAQILISRLERLSADSFWAHQASGLRGSLLRWVAKQEAAGESSGSPDAQVQFEQLIKLGYHILGKAAKETLRGRSEFSRRK